MGEAQDIQAEITEPAEAVESIEDSAQDDAAADVADGE